MGKDKTAQRTKGNLKPSSSGRSAELLGGVNEFVGFGGLGDLGYVPAATQFSVEDDAQISAEFRVTLRKMSKKDTVTKIKALQEFECLCSSENVECIKTAVPYWPRLYSKLCLDCDRRVREAVQVAHASLVHVLRKNLAPYLRSVMPSWLIAMADPHTPVRTSATKSFQTSFSEDKRSGVMAFCSKDIMDCISDYLFVQTSKTLVDAKYNSVEDQESKYVRVIFCSLKGLAVFMSYTTKPADKVTMANRIILLLNEDKFWKYARHESTLIRVAWYECISSIFESNVELLRPHTVRLAEIIFTCLNESNTSVLPNVWVVFLHICVSLKECWEHCQDETSVFDQIFEVLNDGCRGCAMELSPLLLPMISVIPNSVVEKNTGFYCNFFKSISVGLSNTRLLLSRSGLNAMIGSYFECLLYLTTLTTITDEDCPDRKTWSLLIEEQVVVHLESALVNDSQLNNSTLFEEVASFICRCSTKKGGKHYLNMFWSAFIPSCCGIIEAGNSSAIVKLKKLMTVIKNPPQMCKPKGVKQKYATKEQSLYEACTSLSAQVESVEISDNGFGLYEELANKYVSQITSLSYAKFSISSDDHLFDLFAYLVSGFPCDALYQDMIDKFLKDKFVSGDPKRVFLEELILPLLEEGKDVPILPSLDIFMHVYSQLSSEVQKNLLDNLKPTLRIDVFRLLMEKLSESNDEESVGIVWLKSTSFVNRASKAMRDLCDSNSREKEDLEFGESLLLIKFIFRNGGTERTDFLNVHLSDMLTIIKEYLKIKSSSDEASHDLVDSEPADSDPVDSEAQCTIFNPNVLLLLSDIVEDLLQCPFDKDKDYLNFVFSTLFQYLCSPNVSAESEMRENIFDSAMSGFKIYVGKVKKDEGYNILLDNTFCPYILNEIKYKIMSEDTTYDHIQYLVKISKELLLIIQNKLEQLDEYSIILDQTLIERLVEGFLPTEKELNEMEDDLSSMYIAPAILKGLFYCHQFPLSKRIGGEKCNWNQSYVKMCCFLVELMLSLCSPTNAGEAQACDDIPDESVNLGVFTRWSVVILHANCYGLSVMEMMKRLKQDLVSEDIEDGILRLEEKTDTLLQIMNSGNRNLVVKILKDRCIYGTLSWCLTLHYVLSKWPDMFSADCSKLIDDIDQSTLGATATTQILLRYQPSEYLLDYLNEEVSKMASLSDDPFSALPHICTITSTLEQVSSAPEDIINALFESLIKWRESANNIFLFASDLYETSWEDISLSVSIVRLLTVIVSKHSAELLHAHWDLILCSLAAWNQSLGDSSKASADKFTVVAMFAAAVSSCVGSVGEVMSKLRDESIDKSKYPPSLLEEWDEFFSPSIYETFISIFVACNATYSAEKSIILYLECIELARSVFYMDASEMKDIQLTPRFSVSDYDAKFQMPDNITYLLNHLTTLLMSPHPATQGTAFTLFSVFLPNLMISWEERVADPDNEELLQMPLPYPMLRVIQDATPGVSESLEESEFGTFQDINPHTKSHTVICGYLLSWLLTLRSITHGKECNQQLYCTYIRDCGLLEKLLEFLFKLMPSHFKEKTDYFTKNINLIPADASDHDLVERLACRVYIQCLNQLPAAVRTWWTNLDRHSQHVVDKFTTTYVSPILIATELNTINESTRKFDNMVVKSRPGAREIVASYTIDEASMELVLRLAPNHPLCTVTLEDHKRVGVSVSQWRNWLFGLNTMLSHRNTPLLNSLEFWKKNVDQKFEGIEECYICYYVLHGSNHQIPKLLCRTCKKKFHPVCLYKWFNTSNNSTCPICRSLF